MSELVQHISDDQFESTVIKSEQPVLVDFWAEWCGPCKMVAPILDELAKDYEGKLKIVKINVDKNQQKAAQFGVRSIPTLLLFKDGELQKTQIGAANKTDLSQMLDTHITA